MSGQPGWQTVGNRVRIYCMNGCLNKNGNPAHVRYDPSRPTVPTCHHCRRYFDVGQSYYGFGASGGGGYGKGWGPAPITLSSYFPPAFNVH